MFLPLMTDQISEGYVILMTGLLIVFSALVTLMLFFKFGLPLMLFIYKIITKGKIKTKNHRNNKTKTNKQR